MKLKSCIVLALFLTSCNEDFQPKPKAYLALKYPKKIYQNYTNSFFDVSFEHNKFSEIRMMDKPFYKLVYPEMKATIYFNHSKIKNNFDSLLSDAYGLPLKHIGKADVIDEKIFVNNTEKVYGTLFSIIGNGASQFQFFVTDSTNNFLVGSLYFYSRPNYDSIYPAIKYIEKDISHLMTTLKWE
jgi:gliding motility-associated lipoprotein GldD